MQYNIDGLYSDERLASARKILMIVSILFLTINISAAKLLEANTFIFKVSFSNSAGFNVILLVGVLILTVRYYSLAYPYHGIIFQSWSNEMLHDELVLSQFRDEPTAMPGVEGHEVIVGGLLSKHPIIKNLVVENLKNSPRSLALTYKMRGFLSRYVYYYHYDNGKKIWIGIELNVKLGQWGWKDLVKLLFIENKYQFLSFIKRHESLEIMLPYGVSLISIYSFLRTEQCALFMTELISSAIALIL